MTKMQDPIEKLRDYAAQCCPEYEQYDSHMMRLADEIEAAYMRLPVGKDDVPIRDGDTVECDTAFGRKFCVFAVARDCWVDIDGFTHKPEATRHVNPDTVEGIIAEAMSYACEPESPYSVNSKYVREYAERIWKAVGK